MALAIYPGSFDPMTNGHLDLVKRASRLFDTVIMAVANNAKKKATFSAEERVAMIQACVTTLPNVRVMSFEGLTSEFLRQHQARVLIRGLRAISDFEYELMMSQMNKILNEDCETVFLGAGQAYQFLSSSVVKEVASLGGDISSLVPPAVLEKLQKLKVA